MSGARHVAMKKQKDLEKKVAVKHWKELYVRGVPIEITFKKRERRKK